MIENASTRQNPDLQILFVWLVLSLVIQRYNCQRKLFPSLTSLTSWSLEILSLTFIAFSFFQKFRLQDLRSLLVKARQVILEDLEKGKTEDDALQERLHNLMALLDR